MRATSPVPVFIGIAISALGFLLIVYAWARIAAETAVALQLPYLVSGGLAGIALVLVGLTLANIQSRRIEGSLQSRQIERVAASVAALHEGRTLSDDDAFSVGDAGDHGDRSTDAPAGDPA